MTGPVRLADLAPDQRRLIAALIEAQRVADQQKAVPIVETPGTAHPKEARTIGRRRAA